MTPRKHMVKVEFTGDLSYPEAQELAQTVKEAIRQYSERTGLSHPNRKIAGALETAHFPQLS